MKLLEKTHKGKIDFIYIDPPYNTLNEGFIYDDKMIDNEDGYKHSKWLSFMKKRLEIAYKLLNENGLLFISIDDNEIYGLKLLCDEIFKEESFLNTLVIETGGAVYGPKASNIDKKFVKTKDYILIYQKYKNSNHIRQPLYDSIIKFDTHYSKIINNNKKTSLSQYLFPPKIWKYFNTTEITKDYFLKMMSDNEVFNNLINSLSVKDMVDDFNEYIEEICMVHNKFMKYGIKENTDNISKLMELDEEFENYIYNSLGKKLYRDYPFNKTVPMEILIKLTPDSIIEYNGFLLFKTRGGVISYYKNFIDGLKVSDEFNPKLCRVGARGDFWKGFHQDMTNIDNEGGIKFKNGKKPKRLIKQLLKWQNMPNATVLDFFAGSGTTGQAVLELNEEDGGNRKFILCTNNENNICTEITYPRMKTVITGIKKDNTKYSNGIPANLKYFKTNLIPKDTEDLEDELLEASIPLIELENFISLDNATIKVIFNEEELEIEIKNIDTNTKIFYIAEDIILSNTQKEILKRNNIELKRIPKYYYKNEM